MTDTTNSPTDNLAAWRAAGGKSGPALDPITKAAANPTSRALAILAKCYDCQGQDADTGWRWRIGNCDAPCPLAPVRPYQHMAGRPTPAAIADHQTTTRPDTQPRTGPESASTST